MRIRAISEKLPDRLNPWAAIPLLAFCTAQAWPLVSFDLPYSISYQLALLLLASPFMVLILAHHHHCRTWRRHLFVALLNIPLGCAYLFAVVMMWYFRPGLSGAFLFGAVLSGLAWIGVQVARLVPERHGGPSH